MDRVTGRDTAYRDKPCRRADYGFHTTTLFSLPRSPSVPAATECGVYKMYLGGTIALPANWPTMGYHDMCISKLRSIVRLLLGLEIECSRSGPAPRSRGASTLLEKLWRVKNNALVNHFNPYPFLI